MRIGILILLLFVTGLTSFSQTNDPPVFIIRTDTAKSLDLNETYIRVLPDPEEKLSFRQVTTAPLSGMFSGDNKKYTNDKGNVYPVIWKKYRIRNAMSKSVEIAMNEPIARADVYFQKNGTSWEHQVTGITVPWSKRSGLKQVNTLLYALDPGDEVFIYKREEVRWKRKGVTEDILFARQVISNAYINDTNQLNTSLLSLFAGMLIFAAMINFFFFFVVRERVYFFYALTILFGVTCFYHFVIRDLVREYPQYYEDFGSTLLLLTLFLSIFTVRYFLQTRIHYPRWDRCLAIISWVFIISVPLAVMLKDNFNILLYVPKVLIVVVFGALVITPLLFLGKKYQYARLFIIAFIPIVVFLVLLLFVLLFSYSLINSLLPIALLTGVAWLICVLSWALFVRFKNLLNENAQQALDKERLAREKEVERNELIARQKVELEQEVQERTAELKQSLEDLKATQTQLIQSEKMASLGELTAGIAHEIQNPLNFVNNFSEVSAELTDEMVEELEKGDTEEAIAIAGDIKQNLEKIRHHGKRADAIVKGMLQHSRSGSGIKELTDINVLLDECLRLSYHGLRAKDKSFNATLETAMDEQAGKLNVVPQDLSRVFLNLFTNAFYSVTAKKKMVAETYQPTVSVITKRMGGELEIRVRDNGTGIPKSLLDKIYQPFFTTKPTGEGTGLGLSLSYDMITKGHNGTISVDTAEGEFAEFKITLPIS